MNSMSNPVVSEYCFNGWLIINILTHRHLILAKTLASSKDGILAQLQAGEEPAVFMQKYSTMGQRPLIIPLQQLKRLTWLATGSSTDAHVFHISPEGTQKRYRTAFRDKPTREAFSNSIKAACQNFEESTQTSSIWDLNLLAFPLLGMVAGLPFCALSLFRDVDTTASRRGTSQAIAKLVSQIGPTWTLAIGVGAILIGLIAWFVAHRIYRETFVIEFQFSNS